MRRAKSLVCTAFLGRGMASLAGATVASAVLLCAVSADAEVPVNHVRDVRVRADAGSADGAEIEIVGSSAPSYNVRVADGGRRILIDLSDADVAGAPAALTTSVGVVGGILTQAYPTSTGSMTRLTVSLQRDSTYRLVPDGTTLRVLLAPRTPAPRGAAPDAPGTAIPNASPSTVAAPNASPSTAAAPNASPSTAAASSVAASSVAASSVAASSVAASSVAASNADSTSAHSPESGALAVRDVRFERAPAAVTGCAPYGCDRVTIDLPTIPSYAVSTSPGGGLRLELHGTTLPAALARTLDVTAYGGVLKSVTASHDAVTGSTTLELERTAEATGTISVDGGRLVWSFLVPKPNLPAPPAAQLHLDRNATGRDGGPIRHVVTVAREELPADQPRIETSIHDEDPVVETSGGGAAGFASSAGGVLGSTALQRTPDRHRPQRRRHPQHPEAPCGHGSRQHRDRR